ncbi:MAG TPA: hypothetical protein VLH09_05335, partial [Bryobacteraceae bacterium]|nr:hypothetical protein [Bryobacteraceae bacterium]
MGFIGHINADSRLCSVLAGLEAGILGGLCLLLWQASSSALGGEDARTISADLGAVVFGRRAQAGSPWPSLAAGYALQVFGGGLV